MKSAAAFIQQIIRHPTEITVRGESGFTFSFAERDAAAVTRVSEFFSGQPTTVSAEFDDELNETFIYLDLPA